MKSVGPRLGLLIALVPLLLACVPLVMFLPSDGSRMHWVDKSSQQAVFEFVSYRARSTSRPWARVLCLDLNSGELRQLPIDQQSLAESYHFGDGKLHWQSYPEGTAMFGASHRATNAPTRRCDLTTFDLTTGKIERATILEDLGMFPISERLQVLIKEPRVLVLDVDGGMGIHDLEGVTNAADAAVIPNSNRFLLVDPTYTSDNKNQKPSRMALYEMDPNGVARRFAEWRIGNTGRDPFWCFLEKGNEVASLSPDRQQIEVYSSIDGLLIRRQPVPAGLTGSIGRSELLTSRLIQTTLTSRRAFDIERGEWLPSPPGEHWIEDESIENGLILYRDDSKFEEFTVLDRATSNVLCRFTIDYGSEARFLDARRIAVTSFHYGMTVRVIDAVTGITLSLHRPLFWIVPTLFAVLMGYAVWSTAWMVVSARFGFDVVWDIALVVGIPLAILILRIGFGGAVDDIRRMPIHCLHGMALAGAMLLATWIVFGQRRISLRVLALLAYYTLLLAGLASTYFHESQLAWLGIATVVVPALVFTLPLLVLQTLGWRVERTTERAMVERPNVRRIEVGAKFHLRDLLAGTFVVAVLFAVTRSIQDTIGSLVEINYIQWPMLGAQFSGLAILFVVLWQRTSWIFPLAIMMMVAAVGYLAQESIASLARTGQRHFWTSEFDPRHSLLACLVTLFVVLAMLRLRGWQLRNCSMPFN